MTDTTEKPVDQTAPERAEGTSSEAGAAAPQAAPGQEDAAARIAALEAEMARLKDQALRAMAEAENTRRRAQREIEENSKFALAGFARDVLPVADNLRRAIDAIPAEARQQDERLNKFAEGVEMTDRELLTVLERHGVKRVDPAGQAFDHNLHQAIMQVDSADHPPGTVVDVFQPGFTINGRLLRPAMVTVAKAPGGQAGAKVDTTA